jgi:hypothetical protein
MSRNPKSLALGLGHEAAPAFMAWFSGSKIVDPSGAPLVVYHGTNIDITEFNPERVGSNYSASVGGFFFSNSPRAASDYAVDAKNEHGGEANVLPVYLHLSNPLVVETEVNPDRYFDKNRFRLIAQADQGLCDGVVVRGEGLYGPQAMYLVFLPEQIKSAIGNNGQYSPENPDIRYSSTPSYRECAR